MKSTTAVLIAAAAFCASASADHDKDCTIEKHMAGHAHSMILGGATLNLTIEVLADTEPKKLIIEKVFNNRSELDGFAEASEYGVKLCREMSAGL